MTRGLIHIYCGDGKGKTTAAAGLAVRAAGAGKRVLFVQFLKGQPSGEIALFEELPTISVLRAQTNTKFSWDMTAEEKEGIRSRNNNLLAEAFQEAHNGSCDLLVLDEVFGACSAELLDENKLLAFMRAKPEGLELVLTGLNPSQAFIDNADYVTEMRKIKHPYDKNILARKGVEY